jgi:hypothetical protein
MSIQGAAVAANAANDIGQSAGSFGMCSDVPVVRVVRDRFLSLLCASV